MLKKLTVIDKRSNPQRQPSNWSGHLEMGENLQVRARRGYRAAVITLEPGLYLVSEINQAAMDEQPQEIGFAFLPLLSAGMITAAAQALQNPKKPLNLANLPKNLGRWLRRKRPDESTTADSDEDGIDELPRWLQRLTRKKTTTEKSGSSS